MTLYNGNLLDAIDDYLNNHNSKKFALLVIDEQGGDRSEGDLVNAMLQTISFSESKGFQIVTIEIITGKDTIKYTPTRKAFTAIMKNPIVFYKRGYNAFGVIDESSEGKLNSKESSLLHLKLSEGKVTDVIVLGRQAGQCVMRTVIGGAEGSPNKRGPEMLGALALGYQVWTSPKIMEGDGGGWTKTEGVNCYSAVQ